MTKSADSSSSSPQLPPRYPTPLSYTHGASTSSLSLTSNSSSTSIQSVTSSKPKTKSANVFSNDGSFLERFQRNKMEEQEKQKVKEELNRKIQFEDRFKNRSKRKLPPLEDEDNEPTLNSSSGTSNTTGPGHDITQEYHMAKKPKAEETLNDYQQELKKYHDTKAGLSDAGTGFRPLVK